MSAHDTPLLFKVGPTHNRQDSIQQRNHVLWTRTMQTTVPSTAPFHIAPILEDGYLDGVWHWFITPFIEGQPLASQTDHVISIAEPERLMPNIVALMRHIEKTEARTTAGIDARYGSVGKKDKLRLLERFLNNFLCLSALRAIGNWMENNNSTNAHRQKRLGYAKRYAEDIVTYRLVNL